MTDEGTRQNQEKQKSRLEISSLHEKVFRIMIWKWSKILEKNLGAKIDKLQKTCNRALPCPQHPHCLGDGTFLEKVQENVYLKRWNILILVCLGHCKKTPQTGWLINNRSVFLLVLETGSPRSGACMARFWWRPSSRLQAIDFALCPHVGSPLWDPFYKSTTPMNRAPLSWSKHFPKAPPSMPSHWALRF